jgi:hypothetical protein
MPGGPVANDRGASAFLHTVLACAAWRPAHVLVPQPLAGPAGGIDHGTGTKRSVANALRSNSAAPLQR